MKKTQANKTLGNGNETPTVEEQAQLDGMKDKADKTLTKLAKEVHALTTERMQIHAKEREKRSALSLKMAEKERKIYRVPGTNLVAQLNSTEKLSVTQHAAEE